MRELVTSYLDEFCVRGDAIAFAQRRGLRTVRWSYERIATSAFAFAHLLSERGIKKSDQVLLCGNNSPEWIVAFFGCLLRGAIVVPIDVQSEPGFVERIQRQVNAKHAIVELGASETLRFPIPVMNLAELESLLPTDQFATADSADFVAEHRTPNDIAEIVFTSGTTAEPKGVVLTHQNLLANLLPLEREIRPYLKWERLVHPIRFLNLLPLSHVFGQFMGIFVPQLLGAEVFFLESLKPSRIVETVKRERISVIVCVPRLLETLRELVEREYGHGPHSNGPFALDCALEAAREWSVPRRWWKFRRVHRMFGWKFWAFISGGATLDAATEQFWQQLGFAIIQGYGMTETASLISVNHPFKKRSGSIGRVMHGQEIKLSDEGEILVRGANVSTAYWSTDRREDAQLQQEERWFHTGDVGELDANGNLYFKGRKKDVIVTAAGMNVYPEDIEAVLIQQPQIKSAAVVGVEGSHGPEPVAALILRTDKSPRFENESTDLRAARAIEGTNRTLAEHQKVRRWFIWPEEDFPRTPTEKVKRHLIATRIATLDQAPPARSSSALLDLIGHVSGGKTSALNAHAKLGPDVNLDSLGRLELLNAIEDRYQVELNETAFTDATTVAEIEDAIRNQLHDAAVAQPLSPSGIGGRYYPYPHWPHRWPISWLRIAALYLIVFPFVRAMGRGRVRGVEKLRDWKGPLLFISNHVSMVDHALILWALPGRFHRRLSIAMDGELLREWLNPRGVSWFTWLRYRAQYLLVAFFFNVFAMPRETGVRRSFEFAGEMVDGGFSLLVFPEGRRSPDGEMKPFRSGIGLLAKQLNVPMVAIRLEGIYELREQGKHFAPPGTITVTIAAPLKFAADTTPEQITAELEARVRNA